MLVGVVEGLLVVLAATVLLRVIVVDGVTLPETVLV